MSEVSIAGQRIGNWLKAQSGAIARAACLLLALLLGTIDFSTPPETELTLFYLLLISFATWSAGRKVGLGVAAASALMVLIREFRGAEHHTLAGANCWNVGMRAGSYFLVSMIVSGLRSVTTKSKWQGGDRTAGWRREASDRAMTEEQAHKILQQLLQLADSMTDVFWMRDADGIVVGYVSPAYERIWGQSARELYEHPEAWLEAIHIEDRERIGQIIFNPKANTNYDVEYRIVRADGSLRWIRERAFPIHDVPGKLVCVVGFAEDNTDRRRLEREIIEVSDREHARFGQDLHDGLCQKLIALAFDCRALEQRLAARTAPEEEAIRRLAGFLDELILEARATARGLFPVQLETDGLTGALQQLAATAGPRLKADFEMETAQPDMIIDPPMATHLYRIAQEALNNAVKHSEATVVNIRLGINGGRLELRVADNGAGIAQPHERHGGMGLHIMEYRARMIGGLLSVTRGAGGGTVVSCIAPLTSV